MKKVFTFFLIYLCFGFMGIILPQEAQNLFTKELKHLLNNRNQSEKKVESSIFYKFHQYSKNIEGGKLKSEAIKVFNRKNYKIDNSNRILLNIKLNSKDDNVMTNVVNQIISLNGEIESIHKGKIQLSEIFCWLPVDQIIKLSEMKEISFINNPGSVLFWSGEYTTVGDDQLKASNVRNTFNVDGTGYKIGVISDGVQSYFYNYIPTEELENVSILDPGFGGDEGTAMLEIIHDIAPGAQLYFHGLDNTPNYFELKDAISALIAEDCDIIVDDIGFDTEPYFTDWTDLGEVIKNFINQGGIYISSAGNAKNEILDENTNFDNSYHTFSDGNTYLNVNLPEGGAVILQWKDSWLLPTQDFNLEVYDQQNNLLPGGDNNQQNFLPPIEVVEIENTGSYKIKIKNISGSSNIEFKLWPRGTEIQNNGSNQIFGHSAFPNVISVAAYQGDDETVVSEYSSGGPATMFSSAIFDWTTQDVPTITATAGVETFVGVTGLWPSGNPVFSGTSASAPHIAGLAALYFQKLNDIDQLNKSNFDFINDLKASGNNIDNYTGGIWNYESGYGKANILDAINQAGLTVSTPIITPVSGSFYQSVTCTLSCQTVGATIKYTIDNSDPSPTNGTDFDNQPFILSTLGSVTVKAKAFKNGLLSSAIKSENYDITNLVAPILDKSSGEYLTNTQVNITWPVGQNLRLYYQIRTDGSIPPDPGNSNFGRELITHPGRYFIVDGIQKIKFRIADFTNYTNPTWGPVVYVEYTGKPGLRIAQIDDEITQGSNSFGEWYKWEDNNHWAAHPDETIFRPTSTSDWYLQALQEFKDPANNVFRKYNVWQINGSDNYFVNYSKISVGTSTSSILAHFKQAYDLTVSNKLENSFSVNQGSFIFKNPWIVDDNSDSKGSRNRGDGTVVPLLPYTINFSTTPNITTGSIHKGVFLNQPYTGNNPVYYSVKVDEVQPIDPGGTIGTRDFYFLNWSAYPPGSAEFQNADALETPVVFKSEDATVQANLKGHLFTNSPTATASNNQRKIVQGSNGYWAMVYVSMDQVWLSRSTDGVNWEREILISDYVNGDINGCPSVDVYNDQAYIVWQNIYWVGISGWNTAYINVRRYDLSNNTLGPTITAASFEPPTESYASTPVIAYDGGKSNDMALAWREPDGIKLLHGDGELGDDYINWGNVFNVTGTNSYSSNPSIAYASGQDFAICWAQSSSGYKIYYTTATENYNPEWIFGATELISPSYWESNINPQITVVDRYHPTIVWTSKNNVVEGGPSVHIKQRSGLGTNDTWGGITSFSHYNSNQNLNPVIGNYSESTKMEILWNFGTYIYKASYNGSNWSGPSILSTSGGNGVNINRNSAWNTYQTKALWEKTDNALAFYNVGNAPLSKIVATSENEPVKLPYRLNRHAIIELPKDIDSTATGSVCFEMAGISTLYNYSETKVNYSFNEINLLASEPIKVAAPGMQFKFSGAIYGAGLELQNNFVSSISEPLAKVVLKDSKTNETLQSIWVNNPSMLNQVENKTFGEFRNVFVDLNKYLGKTVYVQVEMIGKSKGVKPLIVDDYLILSDSTSISENLAKKNYTDYSLPTEYTLMQNFPNPFNPSTTITFYLPEAQHTILKIYNVLGKEVMTVVNENLAAGYHSVDINMSNEPSGVYLYSLSAGSFRNTKKLMLMK